LKIWIQAMHTCSHEGNNLLQFFVEKAHFVTNQALMHGLSCQQCAFAKTSTSPLDKFPHS
jgi:hypothetical protein